MDNFTIWFSINATLGPLAIGAMAGELFNLGFWEGLACILVGNVISILPGALFTTFGCRYGTSQMTITRYSYGIVGTAIPVMMTLFTHVGYSILTLILGAQMLSASANVPSTAGIVFVAFLAWAISVSGYTIVHQIERYVWIIVLCVFFVVAIVSLPSIIDDIALPSSSSTTNKLGSLLSFVTLIVANYPILYTCAADYSVHQPTTFDPLLVGGLSFLGSFLPSVSLELLGLVLMMGIQRHPAWQDSYQLYGIGGLLGGVLAPLGVIGKMLIVLLGLGVAGSMAPIEYSVSLGVASLYPQLPAAFYNSVMAISYTLMALAAADRLIPLFQAFACILVYIFAPYAVVLLLEHFFFRRGAYPLTIWNDRTKLPPGVAALAATSIGAAAAVLGMKQSWFEGPASKVLGGDVGLWLALATSTGSYAVLRIVERNRTGR
ncbi:permease for cytosine/purines, uracil, thiamine, allantoin-domain-containing protein [Dichotomocladium elegans]|nr:permease for cytosine/purines, uracil, thiamine, allantoin-domain-containing protein [Dichotomocladium elegans]